MNLLPYAFNYSETVLHKAVQQIKKTTNKNTKKKALIFIYYRFHGVLSSLVKINDVNDFQLISAGCRLAFELLVDAWTISKELVPNGPKKFFQFYKLDQLKLAKDFYDHYLYLKRECSEDRANEFKKGLESSLEFCENNMILFPTPVANQNLNKGQIDGLIRDLITKKMLIQFEKQDSPQTYVLLCSKQNLERELTNRLPDSEARVIMDSIPKNKSGIAKIQFAPLIGAWFPLKHPRNLSEVLSINYWFFTKATDGVKNSNQTIRKDIKTLYHMVKRIADYQLKKAPYISPNILTLFVGLYKPMSQQVHGGCAGQLGNEEMIHARYGYALLNMVACITELFDLISSAFEVQSLWSWGGANPMKGT